MGFIRGGLLIVVGVLLFLSLFIGDIFLVLTLSLDYDNVHQELSPVVKDFAAGEGDLNQRIQELYPSMESSCQNYSEFVFSEQGYTFIIPCSVVAEGSEAVMNYGTDTLIKEIYYKEYNCGFWDCIGETEAGFFLVSEKAKNYWKSKFYFLLVASIVLIALAFLLVEKKINLLIITGGLLTLSALLLSRLNWFFSFISDESLLQFFTIFFTKTSLVFWVSIILGIILLLIGILLKLFWMSFKISNLFSKKEEKGISKKDVKEIVKKEVSKKKK